MARSQHLIFVHAGVRGTVLHAGTSGYTPLHYAARAGHVAASTLLLQRGVCHAVCSAVPAASLMCN